MNLGIVWDKKPNLFFNHREEEKVSSQLLVGCAPSWSLSWTLSPLVFLTSVMK